ncbi:hypothetical protein KW851_28130 [Pseudomonas sp. PDM33]|uniref:hypothetical protein n=1 Tax=unclassified Pseudomonas TaxID=196821 RepID=UPI000A4282C0|nr:MULTISPECIES: hypothetical protein [unclassified Pseudomonas]MBV7586727.1 hypothetical protein [Pseudomonas sp. PDM33]
MSRRCMPSLRLLPFSIALALCGGLAHAAEPAWPAQNPYLAQSYNNQTHWNDGATDSVGFPVARGAYDVTPDSVQFLPGEGVGLPIFSDTVDGKPVYFWWSGFALRKVSLEGGKLTELARADIPVKLPNYTPVTAQQRVDQSRAVQKFLDAKDEKGLLDYMKTQPNRMLSAASDQALNGSVYALLTREDAFVGCNARQVFRIDQVDPKRADSAMKLGKASAIPANLFDNEKVKRGTRFPGDMLFGMSMSYNGFIVVNTLGGKIITLNRDTLEVIDTYAVAGNDELFLNSFATGPEANGGAIYVASNTTMYRLVVDSDGKIHDDEAHGAWKAGYERGIRMPAPKIADGTGATPTLMGFGPDEDKLVVITDGAKNMSMVAFWRDQIPAGWKQKPGTASPRIADQRKVEIPGTDTVQSEQSVAVYGDYAFVVNNIRSADEKTLDPSPYYVSTLLGATRPGPLGAASFRWNSQTHEWKQLWGRNDVSSISVVPMISGEGHMALIDGYFSKAWNDRYHIGMDLDTGKTVLTIREGSDPIYNGMYAPIKVDTNGNIFYGTAFGLLHLDTSKMKQDQLSANR